MQKVLTIAGSDSLAGGGLQADLKTFEDLNVFGVSVITSIASIFEDDLKISAIDKTIVEQQIDSIVSQLSLTACKTGLLGNVENAKLIANELKNHKCILVVDPVLVFKEGSSKKDDEYLNVIKNELLPLATITTPNLKEAEQLSGIKIDSAEKMPQAAAAIQALGCKNVVIKGGSRLKGDTAIDYLLAGQTGSWLESSKIDTSIINGAGCTFSAAITAYLALGEPIESAVKKAKDFVHSAIIHGVKIGTSGSVWQGGSKIS